MKMKRVLSLAFVCVTIFSYGQQATISDFGFYTFDNSANTGHTLLYRMLKPFDYDSLGTTAYPVFIWMHPNGRQGTNNTNQMNDGWAPYLMDSLMRVTFPSFVIAPQCKPGFNWGTENYQQNVTYLIEHLKTVEQIDKDRIYLMGWSLGSFAIWSLVRDGAFPNYYAAAVPIAGANNPNQGFDPHAYGPTAIWANHGINDGVIRVRNTRRIITLIREAGYHPIYTEFPVGHGSHDETMGQKDIFTWIFSQNRSGGNLPPAPSNLQVSTLGNTATLTWDIPSVSLSVDSIMAYHVYKNGNRITTDISDLVDSTATGISELLRQNTYVDPNYSAEDSYEVTAVNFRNQESPITTSLNESAGSKDEPLLFPNPAESFIQVSGDFQSTVEYSILTMDGRMVQGGFLESQRIDIQKLTPGIYLIVIDGKKAMKFLKN